MLGGHGAIIIRSDTTQSTRIKKDPRQSKLRSLGSKIAKRTDYIDAIAMLYKDWEKLTTTRCINFEKAMENVYTKYPNDKEARYFMLCSDAAADPADKSFGNQRKAGTILMPYIQTNQTILIVTYYYSYDYPAC